MRNFTLKVFFGLLLSGFIFFLNINPCFSQCTPSSPAVAACSGGNGAATNGVNINGGQTFWFTGGPTTFGSGVNLNGGVLRICGNLILSSINFNSGNIIIESTGSLTINAGFNMNGSSGIANRGILVINGSVTMQNSNNTIWNDILSASTTINGTLNLNSSSSKFINKGTAVISTLLNQAAAGAVCIEQNSCLTATNFTNNVTNGVTYSGAGTKGVIRVTGSAQLNSNVTSTSSVIACLASGYTHSGGAGWGSATVVGNCSTCSQVLPATALSLHAIRVRNDVQLQWQFSNEIAGSNFAIERSMDGIQFNTIPLAVTVTAGQTAFNYSASDASAPLTNCYYRIKQAGIDGQINYSAVISVGSMRETNGVFVYPNPVRCLQPVYIAIASPLQQETANLYLLTAAGKQVWMNSYLIGGGQSGLRIAMPTVPPGLYFLKLISSDGNLQYCKKMVVTD